MKIANLLGFSSNRSKPDRYIPLDARDVVLKCRHLLSERGEVTGVRLATEILGAYQKLHGPALAAFFDHLVKEFSPDPQEVGRWGDAYRSDPSPGNLAKIQRAVEPLRQDLFRRLNMAPGGTGVLVGMRSQLLKDLKKNPAWAPIEADLAHLLTSWFNRGFLVLRSIDWRSSATVLEKLIKYEAVHEVASWQDLRRRLETDRRCYAFFHPALPDEPVIFIQVALTDGMSANVQRLLDLNAPVCDPKSADCAMFYSITNCQEGLRGISFGSFLIKQVVEELQQEFRQLRRFATLSPIPGFRQWLDSNTDWAAGDRELLAMAARVKKLDTPQAVQEKLTRREQDELRSLCAYYLLSAKQGSEPMDSVARFHLRNGARLDRLNLLADVSSSGIRRSFGMMVNYVYHLRDLERNHEAYSRDHKVIASRYVEWLAKRSVIARRESQAVVEDKVV